MEALKGMDDVAYVRFASVYKNFRDPQDFQDLLGELGGNLPPVSDEPVAPSKE